MIGLRQSAEVSRTSVMVQNPVNTCQPQGRLGVSGSSEWHVLQRASRSASVLRKEVVRTLDPAVNLRHDSRNRQTREGKQDRNVIV